MFAPYIGKREPTDTSLAEGPRRRIVDLLKERLADAIALQGCCREAHWYATGPEIVALHRLYIDVYWSVESYVRLLTKRVVELGGARSGALRIVPRRSDLDDTMNAATLDDDHVQRMCLALTAFGSTIRAALRTAEELEDAASAELCTSIARGVDRWIQVVGENSRAANRPTEGARFPAAGPP